MPTLYCRSAASWPTRSPFHVTVLPRSPAARPAKLRDPEAPGGIVWLLLDLLATLSANQTERPFELHLDNVTVSGRADVILEREGGVTTALAIVDYKTSTDEPADHALQLQVYADAGRREGLDVRGAYIHDLARTDPFSVDISSEAVADAERRVNDAALRLRSREYDPKPEKSKCGRCDVRAVCNAAR